MGKFMIYGTHETLPKYTSQARDANLRHSDWLKSASRVARRTKQLRGVWTLWHIRAVLILISHAVYTVPSVNTPHVINVLSNQIV